MAKINQEEYEVLKPKLEEEYTHVGKSRDGKLQFLQGYIERDMKREEWSDGWGQTYMRPVNLFQFIQWEDEEPYNIAELIEEYESEETEVNKDKLWAKFKIREELESWREVEGGIDEEGVNYVLNIIDQLEEPDMLTQEWIDNNVIHVRGLGDIIEAASVENIIVPNQEITYEDAIKVIAENIDTDEFSVGLYIEALNNNEKYEFLTEKWIEGNKFEVNGWNEAVHVEDLENLIIPKQELPVIPKYVGEFIEEVKASGDSMDDAFSILRGIYHQSKTADWVAKENRNSEIFARAWLDGYEVEEEPLYYALIKGHELIDSDKVYWIYDKNNDGVFISILHSSSDNFLAEMTESEWNDLGINETNADFRMVDEVAE